MSERSELLESIANTIVDYREDEIQPRTPDLINDWIGQFPQDTRDPILEALKFVLGNTYMSKQLVTEFLTALASTDKLSPGIEPAEYWKSTNILDIQLGGSSQKDLLELFDQVLIKTHGFGLDATGSEGGDYVYLDDCIATGSRIRGDVVRWLNDGTPDEVNLRIVSAFRYQGAFWIDSRIDTAAKENNITITYDKWHINDSVLENRKYYKNASDVLWPTTLPDDPGVIAFAKTLEESGHPAELRQPGNSGNAGVFENDSQKILLEQSFLIRGCAIKNEQKNLPDYFRPLGYHNLETLGFGSMFITYRNCPNNTPLVFWVEQDEYPALFPRKTNM